MRGPGDETHFGKSCLIRMTKPGQDAVCLTAPDADTGGERGDLNVEACGSDTDRWDLIKAGYTFSQDDHSAGWPN
ncbi:hypothetical protein EMMF5_001795 [Cystobasidiomycetes sp. EMM_F5]